MHHCKKFLWEYKQWEIILCFLKKLNIEWPNDLTIPFYVVNIIETKTQTNMYAYVYKKFFHNSQKRTRTSSSLTNEPVNNGRPTCDEILVSLQKEGKVGSFCNMVEHATWNKIENRHKRRRNMFLQLCVEHTSS